MATSDFTVIIPARYASVRFPGKLLAKLKGRHIISWVYEKAMLSNASEVYVATDDERIAAVCNDLSAKVIMTSSSHTSGTSRIYEAAQKINLPDERIIINVQGDEPLLSAKNINQLADMLMTSPDYDMASLTAPIRDDKELKDPNCVKALSDVNGRAIYFSRSPVPFTRPPFTRPPFTRSGESSQTQDQLSSNHDNIFQRHLGIYGYRMSFLAKYVNWKPCVYEELEKLEQLRAIYYGAAILLAEAQEIPPPGVDSPEDLAALEKL